MKVINLIKNFKTAHNNNSTSGYHKSYPELFKHYYKYWGPKLNKKLIFKNNNIKEIIKNEKIIKKVLPKIEKLFNKYGFNLDDLEIILFVGQNISNGHVFLNNKKFKVWIPVETYKTEKIALIFITHEIIHFLHYKANKDFYFKSLKEKNKINRQIITEGIATFLTKKILNIKTETSLWADFLSAKDRKKWMQECNKNTSKLAKKGLDDFNKSYNTEIFQANDPSNIFKFRGGYYLGLKIIENIIKNNQLNINKVLSIPCNKIKVKVEKELKLLTI